MKVFNVLFIDDDPFMLKALLRTAKRLRPGWQFTGCENPLQWQGALAGTAQPDLIFCDYQMPEMSGEEVLLEASAVRPAAMRILLTGDTSEHIVTHAVTFCHAIIAKPFSESDFEQVFNTLERLHELPLTPNCKMKLGQIRGLPVLPEFAGKVKSMLANPEADLHQIAHLLEKEPLITAKLLQIANSPFMGFSSHTFAIHDALTRLGVRLTDAIVTLCLLEQQALSESKRLHYKTITDRAFQVAATSKKLAQLAGISHSRQDLLFSAAIFSAIGELLMLSLADEQGVDHFTDITLQPGFTNNTILSVYILTLWGYDPELCQLIFWQDAPADESEGIHLLAGLLALANAYVSFGNTPELRRYLTTFSNGHLLSVVQHYLQHK